jgi:hypothetical protein
MVDSRRLKWVRHVARMVEIRNAYIILLEGLKGRYRWKDLGLHGMIILKRILKKQGGRVWTGFVYLRIGTSGGLQ